MDLFGHVMFVSCAISLTVVVFYVLSHIHKLRWRALIQQQMEKQKMKKQQLKPQYYPKKQFETPQQLVFDKQEKDFVKRSPSLTFS